MDQQDGQAGRSAVVGPVDATAVPRYAGLATFARLPQLDTVGTADIAVVGVPFDSGVSYRPGARFGPSHIRQSSRLLRPYNPALGVEPLTSHQVADAGDIACNPFHIQDAIGQVADGARGLLERSGRLLVLGGDHTIALPMLRATVAEHGPLASTPTSTPGTPTSASRTPTAHRSAGRPRKA